MKKNIYVYIVYIVLGCILSIISEMGFVDDVFLGMGMCLFVLGTIRLINSIRYKTDIDYKEKIDIELSDERNKFIRIKAWSWAGYLFIIISGIGSIVFMLLSQKIYMLMCSYAVCLMLILFYVSYYVLKRKY